MWCSLLMLLCLHAETVQAGGPWTVRCDGVCHFSMGPRLNGYWLMTWLGLVANLIALPVIGLLAFREGASSGIAITNITLAFSLAWPAAIVGIVASAGLLAQRRWGVILAIVALSMSLAGAIPYGLVRLVLGLEPQTMGLGPVLLGLINVLALIYWCRPAHRRGVRL